MTHSCLIRNSFVFVTHSCVRHESSNVSFLTRAGACLKSCLTYTRTHIHTYTLSHTLPLSLSLSLSHTHTHPLARAHTRSLSLSLSLPHSHPHSHRCKALPMRREAKKLQKRVNAANHIRTTFIMMKRVIYRARLQQEPFSVLPNEHT